MLQERVARLCRESVERAKDLFGDCALPTILEQNPKAASAAETMAYWTSRNREAPSLLRLFQPTIEKGGQPVFAAISLRVSASDPTVVIPVPYLTRGDALTQIREHFWINSRESGGDVFNPTHQAAQDVLREVSHALSNISYSVRLLDEPRVGWLAEAHLEGRPYYIPDAAAAGAHRQGWRCGEAGRAPGNFVHSAAEREERHLAIASVLYIPLIEPSVSEAATAADKPGARAVLMLWSPVPHRWDGCFKGVERSSRGAAYEVQDLMDERLRDHIWRYFHWLEYAAAKDDTSLYRAELQILNFLSTLVQWQDSQDTMVQKAFEQIFHRSAVLKPQLSSYPTDEATPVAHWIGDMLSDPAGFKNLLTQRWQEEKIFKDLEGVSVLLRLPGGEWDELTLAEAAEEGRVARFFDESYEIPLSPMTANYVGGEPVDNIAKYAENLTAIFVTLSRKFVTVRFSEEPRASELERLVGSDDAFRRYYAIRRGLAISPPASNDGREKGHGLGFWLHRVFAARTKVWRKLYISADGKVCHTDLVVPLVE